MDYFFPFLEQHVILPGEVSEGNGSNVIKGHIVLQILGNCGAILLGWLEDGGGATSQESGYWRQVRSLP